MPRKKTPCTIPVAPPIETVQGVTVKDPDHRRREIVEYVEWRLNNGRESDFRVVHLERIKAEVVFGTEHVAWDVHTNEPGRWWVVTGPTNLYSQRDFPSLDFTLSFHVGVTARVASRDSKNAPPVRKYRLRSAWRRWETAMESLDLAEEAEDFQAVGMRCRETLLNLAKSLQKEIALPEGSEHPKVADFIGWSQHLADHFANGARNERIRSYLKQTCRETWQLANWLTHTSKANLHEATLALAATSNLLDTFSMVVTNHEAAAPQVCPECGSYRLVSVYNADVDREPRYVNLCESCDWNDAPSAGA